MTKYTYLGPRYILQVKPYSKNIFHNFVVSNKIARGYLEGCILMGRGQNVYYLLCIFFLLGTAQAIAGPKADSLRRVLASHRTADTVRISLLLKLANLYELASGDSVHKYGTEALAISQKLKEPKWIAGSYEMIGAATAVKGNYDSALYFYNTSITVSRNAGLNKLLASKYNHIGNIYFLTGKYAYANAYYDSALHAAEQAGERELLGKANSNLANVYYKMGNYTRALPYYLKGLKIQEELGKDAGIASDLANIANVYYRLGEYDEAITYTNKALALNRKLGNKESIAGTLTTYAMIYNDRKMFDSSLYYLQQALQLAKEESNPYLENIIMGNIAECYLKKGDNENAEKLYSQSAALSVKLDDAEGLAFARSGLGQVYINKGADAKGRQELEAAFKIMQQLGIKEQMLAIATSLSESYARSGDYKQAYHYQEIQNALSDSLQKEQASQEVAQMVFNYDLEKKQNEIDLLEKEHSIEKSNNQKKNTLIITISLLLVMMGVATYLLYRNRQNIKKSRKLLQEQKEEIELQAQKLSTLNDFKDRTFTLLAHDLRSPVNALAGAMMLMDENVMTPEEFGYHKNELNNKLQSVSMLMDNMLYWARSQMAGEFTFEPVKVNIKRTSLRAISVLKDAANEKQLNVVNEIAEEIWALADRDHVEIIIRNILSNAIKFTPVQGIITLSAAIKDKGVRICIADTGVGMTEDQLNELFDNTAYATTKGTGGERGTGLGMYLCYELAKKNNGNITASSVEGMGSVFTIIFPAAL